MGMELTAAFLACFLFLISYGFLLLFLGSVGDVVMLFIPLFNG